MEIDFDRVERERVSHEDNDVLAKSYKLKGLFPHTLSYNGLQKLNQRFNYYVSHSAGLRVLDFGCGRGEMSLALLSNGASVSGIDISEPYIEVAKNQAHAAGYDSSQYDFRVMDAHRLDFENECFDLVIGSGILHHLSPEIALSEVNRVLRPGGRVIFREPLLDNPLLKLFRYITPSARTKDELPFSGEALARLIDESVWIEDETYYCGAIEAPLAMLTSIILRPWPKNWILSGAATFEAELNRVKRFRRYNQYILFNMIKL